MELIQKVDEMNTAFTEFKKINDQRLKEIEAKGSASADIEEKMSKAQAHMDTLETRIEELKTALARGNNGVSTAEEEMNQKAIEYSKAMNAFLKKGVEIPAEIAQFATKTMSVDSDEDGGFFVSPQMSSEISTVIYESSPIRQLASVQTISSDSLEILYDGDEVGSGWVGETETRSESTTPQLKKIVIPVHELYSQPHATQKLLDDANVNVEAWLGGKISEKFARDEATAFVNGNGVNKPKGILSYASGTGFNQVQRAETAANNAFDGNDFIGVQGSLKEAYQRNASWLMNRLIVAAVRKLKDVTSGQYIWQPGMTAGQPNTLLGRPVYFASDLPSAIAATTDMVIYGDIKAGYQVVDRIGVRVLRDPYTSKPYVKFYTTKRVGGGVKLFEAIKVLKQKT